MKVLIGVCLFAAMAASFAWLAWRQNQYGHGTLTIGGQAVSVEIAQTMATRMRGLSGRPSLPDGQGMVFLFPFPGKHAMWMPNMHFSIDIIWVRDGSIVDIAPNVPPQPAGELPRTYPPRLPANMVIELPTGTANRLGLKIGDTVSLQK